MFRTIRNIRRLWTTARLLARHDALFPLEHLDVAPAVVHAARWISRRDAEGRPGQRLARALNEAGPSFIKLGQILATRSDLLGDELTADLSDLQDRLPPFPGTEARVAIETEFDKPVCDLFAEFDDTPVAAASIAQVHFAVTADGREVAVKVLRPDIEEAFARDLELLHWGAELVERTQPNLRRLKPREVVATLATTVEMEMDLRFEAAAAAELAENFQDDKDFKVPNVDWNRTGRRVMTTERISGVSLDDLDGIESAGFDPLDITAKAAQTTFKQVFRDGFFHADVHPGNLFVTSDGMIAAVDFGIMGRLDIRTRRILGEMLLAFLTREYRRAAEIHFEAGWIPANQSVDAFTQACRSIAEPILDKPQSQISIARLLGQLFQITETFQMETQPQLLLLQKTILVAEGTARKLSPDANMWMLARPLIKEWVEQTLAPEARVRVAVEGIASTVNKLPSVMERLEESANMISSGRMRLHPETIRQLHRGSRGGGITKMLCVATIFLLVMVIITRFT